MHFFANLDSRRSFVPKAEFLLSSIQPSIFIIHTTHLSPYPLPSSLCSSHLPPPFLCQEAFPQASLCPPPPSVPLPPSRGLLLLLAPPQPLSVARRPANHLLPRMPPPHKVLPAEEASPLPVGGLPPPCLPAFSSGSLRWAVVAVSTQASEVLVVVECVCVAHS